MKMFVMSAAAAVTMFGAAIPEAKAGSCDSLASHTAKLWKNWDDVVKGAGCVVATVASEGMIPFPKCLEEANKYDKAVQDMIRRWNQSGHNGSGTIGPRLIDYGDAQTGKVLGTTGRVFVSPAPLLSDEVQILLTKTDGKSKGEVTVCTEDVKRNRHKVWTFKIPNGKDKGSWSKTLKGVKNHILSVHIDGGSFTNTLSYKLLVKADND